MPELGQNHMTNRQSGKDGCRVAILQSNYIPWKGYFDLIRSVDIFVIYDEMQYTREDWRNRNIIKTSNGPLWLTVPVLQKGRFGQRICDAQIDQKPWAKKHWRTIENSYKRAPYFDEVAELLRPLYEEANFTRLSKLNAALIGQICNYLEIKTTFLDSSAFDLVGGASERVANLCRDLGASVYVTGEAARTYLDQSHFTRYSIHVEWFDYKGYPEYRQLWGPFVHNVSIIDLLFMCGRNSLSYINKGILPSQGLLQERP